MSKPLRITFQGKGKYLWLTDKGWKLASANGTPLAWANIAKGGDGMALMFALDSCHTLDEAFAVLNKYAYKMYAEAAREWNG